MSFVSKILKSRLAQNSLWLVVLQCFNTIVPILTLPYVTRILSASEYGKFTLALNWITYIQIFVEYGFGLTGAKKVAMHKNKEELSKVHSNILFARAFIMAMCLFAFLGVLLFVKLEQTMVISLVILFLMVVATVFQQTWFFQGMSEMKNITIINVVSRSISVLLIFMFVKKPEDLYLYCLLYVSNYLIASIVGCLVVYKKYGVRVKFDGINGVIAELKEAFAVFLSSAMGKLFSGLGITVLGFVAISEVVGIYSAINKVTYVLIILFTALSQALYPKMCQSFRDSFDNGIKDVKKYGTPVFLFFCLSGAVLVAFNKPIVRLLFGDDYAKSSLLMIPFVAYTLGSILNNFLGIQILVASGHSKEYSRAFAISSVFMFALFFALGKLWREYGIAYASMLAEYSLTILLLYYIAKIGRRAGLTDENR